MNSDYQVGRLWYPAGETSASVAEGSYYLTTADSQGAYVEWSEDGGRQRRRTRVFTGDTWVLPSGKSWWTRRESGKYCIHLAFSAEWLHRVTHTSTDLLPQAQLRDTLLAQMMRALLAVDPTDPTTTLYRESLATSLVLHLVTHYGHKPARPDEARPLSATRLRQVMDYVAEHLSETIALTDLAQIAGLSASQFSLRFRDTTGQTPHQFVTALRIDRARELLTAGQHSPAEVATLTGFSDQSHLTRHIRRALGVTPGALRKG